MESNQPWDCNCEFCGQPCTWYPDSGKVCSNLSCPEKIVGIQNRAEFWAEASFWKCKCGAQANPLSGHWMWSGESWNHLHPYSESELSGWVTALRIDDDLGVKE